MKLIVKIREIRATTVTAPLEAPVRHANGRHWGRFVRTIVELEADNGLISLGEMGGGGESAEALVRALKPYWIGHDPARLEEMGFLIANPTASLYNNRTQLLGALEFACLDLLGQAWGVPVCDILGGRLRDTVRFASYCFFRYPNPATGAGEVRTAADVVELACTPKRRFGFTTHKLKGGVFHPDYELEAYHALAAAFPGDSLRYDSNGVLSTEQAIRFGQAIERLCNDNLEDPVFGLNGRRRTRQMTRVPLATSTVVVNFEQLATMLHLSAMIPNLSLAEDAHYHHLTDDAIQGGMMTYDQGAMRLPDVPGLGIKIDRDKLRPYNELYQRPGSYPYDRNPGRPGWTPAIPNCRWADPDDSRPAAIPF